MSPRAHLQLRLAALAVIVATALAPRGWTTRPQASEPPQALQHLQRAELASR